MGIIHTPRTLYAVARGLWSRNRLPSKPKGIGIDNPHIYTARMGIFDVDYIGHMNNASYLSHAEYARWQMSAENGLISAMWHHNIHFVVLGSSIRYRKELRPLFRSFQIETTISAIDDANLWIIHNFRHRNDSKNKRIMAQVLVQGAAIQGRNRVDPAELLIQHVGIDKGLVDDLKRLPSPTSLPSGEVDMIQRFQSLQLSFQETALKDDGKFL